MALGCELKYAPRLVYGRGLDLAHPVATPRSASTAGCASVPLPARSAPLAEAIVVSEAHRGVSPFAAFAP